MTLIVFTLALIAIGVTGAAAAAHAAIRDGYGRRAERPEYDSRHPHR